VFASNDRDSIIEAGAMDFPMAGHYKHTPQDSGLSQLMMHEWPSFDELSIRNGTDY
jgi:hypothetical protein